MKTFEKRWANISWALAEPRLPVS